MQEMKLLKVAEFFLINPYKEVYLRELAKELKISPSAAKKYSEMLIREGLILDERKANLRYLKANESNLFYKHLKISYNLKQLLKSGLVEFIKENVANVTSIILFGSLAKGENDDKSDIDITVIGKEKRLDLSKFEDKLDREITIHFFKWSEWNEKTNKDNPFYYEVINYGISLYGELPLVKWK